MSTFSIGLAILFPNPIALEPEICFYSLGTQSKILAKKTKTALLYQKGGFIFEVAPIGLNSNRFLENLKSLAALSSN